MGEIFGDFDVTIEKFDVKTLERDRSDVTVGTKNRKKRTQVQDSIEQILTTLVYTDLSTILQIVVGVKPRLLEICASERC